MRTSAIAFLGLLAFGGVEVPGPHLADPIDWSPTRKLTWADFKARPPASLGGALSALSYRYAIGCLDGRLDATIVTVFVPDSSWVAYRVTSSGLASRIGLRHEQAHFDLKEVHARRARRLLANLPTPCSRSDEALNALVEPVFREESAAQQRFELETRSGEAEQKQIDWEDRIRADLAALTAFAPRLPGL